MAIFSRGLQTWTIFLESDVTYNFDKETADLIISVIDRIPVVETTRQKTCFANHADDEEPTPDDLHFTFERVPLFDTTYFAVGSNIVNLDMFGFWNKCRITRAVARSRKKFEMEKAASEDKKRQQHQVNSLNAIMRELQK